MKIVAEHLALLLYFWVVAGSNLNSEAGITNLETLRFSSIHPGE
jgi:hypothetical protein